MVGEMQGGVKTPLTYSNIDIDVKLHFNIPSERKKRYKKFIVKTKKYIEKFSTLLTGNSMNFYSR